MASIRQHFASRFANLLFATAFLVVAASPAPAQTAAATSTTLAITANGQPVTTVSAGTAVSFAATVASGTTHVTAGTVNFCDATAPSCSDIHLLGSALLSSTGAAQVVVVPPPGVHNYKAQFVSNTTYAASNSPATSLTVFAATTTTISQTGTSGNYTLKAIVTGKGLLTAPTGTIKFIDTSFSNNVLASVDLAAGTPGAPVWSNPQSPSVLPLPQSIAVGDFNGDGISDIAVGHSAITGSTAPGYLSILLGNADGTFQTAKTFPLAIAATSIAVGHFVTGGPLDVIIVDSGPTSATGATTVNNAQLFIGDGTGSGTLNAAFTLGGVGSITSVHVADLNRDGKEDFAVSGIVYGVYAFNFFLGNGDGTFGYGTLNATADNPGLLTVGVFNTNGYPDIVIADKVADNVYFFHNDGQGDFYPGAPFPVGTAPIAMTTGDFNGDGFLDLAVLNSGSDNVTILLGDGADDLTTKATPNTGNAPTAIAVADFNHDGIPDLAVTNSGDNTVTILTGNGDGNFTNTATLNTGTDPVSLAIGNFSGTGQDSIAVANEAPSLVKGSTLTILASTLTQTATATANNIDPSGAGTHLVDASYPGDTNYAPSVSATTSLTAALPPYSVSVSPTSLTFSAQVGATSAAQTVTITNTGANAVTITSITATTDFAVSSACGSSLAAAASCTLSVTFVPTAAGTLTGTLAIADNAAGAPQTVSLSGTATAPPPTVSLSPTSLTFPSVLVGATSSAQSVTLTNTGKSAVTISAVAASANFMVSSGCGSSLAVGASCSLSVVFVPTSSGTLTGTLSITDNATGSPQSISLSGTATLPTPTVSVSPSSLTFATAPMGTTSAAQSVTITNTGQAAVSFTSIAVSGAFTQTNTCGTSLAVSANCTIAVIFAPTQAGSAAGTLTITDNATGSPQTVALSGTGSSVSLSSSTTSLTVNPSGSTATATVQISSSQGFTGTVNLTCAVTYQGTGTALNPPTCNMNPASGEVTATTSLSSTLTVSTIPASSTAKLIEPSGPSSNGPSGNPWMRTGIALAGLLFLGWLPRRRRAGMRLALFLTFGFGLAWMATGCGSSNGPQATAGNYSVVVTATSSTVTASTSIALTVK